MTIDWPRFADLVQESESFVLTSHIRPDCDALGSELGMAGVLEALGKNVRIVNGQATPPNLAFIDPRQRIDVLGKDVKAADLVDVDVLIVLDTSAWAQLGPMGEVIKTTKARKLVVDHHRSEDDLDAEPFKNVDAEATGRLVVEAADALGVLLTKEIAAPVFAAVATDTGWFRFTSAGAGTYRLAARLIEAGADPAAIYAELYEKDTLGRVRLRGLILSRTALDEGGRLGHTYVLKEDFAAAGALPSDTEDAINLVLAVDGVEAAFILVEQSSGGFKISFRSRGKMDCSKLAERFGGGGHKAAAGAFAQGSLGEVQPVILDAVRTAMR